MEKSLKIWIVGGICMVLAAAAVIFCCMKNYSSQEKPVSSEKESLIIGFSQIGSESSWRIRNTESIFAAAKARNIKILFDDAKQKQSNQLKAIRSFIVYQVDVIVFVPIVTDGWENVLQEAKEAGIPVIIIDRQIDVDDSLYAGFLGENGYEEGKAAANFLLKKCSSMDTERINILELAGTANSSIAISRANGFRDVIKTDRRFSIIHSEDGDFLRSRGKEIMDKILVESKGQLMYKGHKIDAIYSHNDSMTLGLLDSLKQKQVPANDTIIISIDAEQKSIDALTQGKLNCVVECNPNLGPILMELVKQIASGKEIPKVTYMHESVFTENDDFSLYKPRGY